MPKTNHKNRERGGFSPLDLTSLVQNKKEKEKLGSNIWGWGNDGLKRKRCAMMDKDEQKRKDGQR